VKVITLVSRYFKRGGSWVATVPPLVREHMGLRPGDILEWNVLGEYVVVRRWVPQGIPFRTPQQIAAALAEKAPGA
jgi:bifunctional DNA-binding transcriptional regulator/antitoxin component of YhaV-PrlF toxin-antitoxin module